MMREWTVDALRVRVFPSRAALGEAAAEAIAVEILRCAQSRETIRMVFAAAPSQNEFLKALGAIGGLPWDRVTAFHMDEYVGLASESTESFGYYLRSHIFDRVRPGRVDLMNGLADPREECARYAALISEAPIDIVCLGIGENGHLAFNDPPVADFNDPAQVKIVTLDPVCRQQQVNDGCFPDMQAVPREAITLTIPVLLGAGCLPCVVPGSTKAQAVRATLTGPIETACPASALRRHANAVLYLDEDSAALTGAEQ